MSIPLLWIIIGITVLISYNTFNDPNLFDKLHFSAYRIKHNKEYYRFLSNVLIHADPTHLLFNMMSLFFLGGSLEKMLTYDLGIQMGTIHFLGIYITGGFVANIYAFSRHADNPEYRSVGASGAVSAVIFAALLWYPEMELYLMFIPIPIPAYIFGPLFLAFEYFGFKRGRGNIAHDAHIGGALMGIVYVLILNIDKGKEFLSYIF